MPYLKKIILILLVALCGMPTGAQNAHSDSLFDSKYARFLELYQTDNDSEFYKVTSELCQYYRQHDQKLDYYKMQLNICLYDTERNRSMLAMKRANNMLEEMEQEHFDGYSQVYMAIGTIYESRGNYHMARHYYEESISNMMTDDKGAKMGNYSRLANLLMLRYPVEAKQWNDMYYHDATTFPPYLQVYYYINGMILFAVNDAYNFKENYKKYQELDSLHPKLNSYGSHALQVADLAFKGNYDEALGKLEEDKSGDLNEVGKFDMRITIYNMMNAPQKALATAKRRAEYLDSLTSDMLFNSMNELNAQTGLSKTKAKAAQDSQRLLVIIIILAAVALVFIASWMVSMRRSRRNLNEKNQQLQSALAMAEEGEKMKTEFVRNVSHEIRTPLNAISGFNDILNTPDIELSAEERSDLLKRINDNVQAITNIVDEMLRMADKESNEFYPKSNKVYCNQFLSTLLYDHRDTVSANIELLYTTKVINRFQIETNEEGLSKIVEQLIKNAIKFTSKGSINLHCELSADNKQVLISVTDTGRGIVDEDKDRIFESFYKGDAFQQGIGLGLTVSRKIAQKLGGDLWLDRDYTEGARFVLSLPV